MMRSHLVQIPALACAADLYTAVNAAISSLLDITTHIPTANRYDSMVKDLLAGAPEKFIIMGTSMGARLALETTLAAPERVQGLVMIGSAAGPVADPVAGLRRSARIRAGDFENVISEMAAVIAHLPGPNGASARDAFMRMSREIGPEIAANQSDALAHRVDRWPQIRSISCPALFLWGGEDQFSPVEDAERMRTQVPHSQLTVIRNCGHLPTLEYPARSKTIIAQWLKEKVFL